MLIILEEVEAKEAVRPLLEVVWVKAVGGRLQFFLKNKVPQLECLTLGMYD